MTLAAILMACGIASAQQPDDIFYQMPSGVKVNQSVAVKNAFRSQVARNADRMFTGFRIRVYHDNSQKARETSEAVLGRIQAAFPGVVAERTYVNPYFNVVMGTFRTRTDAEKVLRTLQAEYPDASIVKEKFKYPTLGTTIAE